jgi:ERCC4-type nuclease
MLIKIDYREKDLLDILVNIPAPSAAPPPTTTEPEPDHYLMDLGDGMTMKVPFPKTNTKTKTKTPQRKSLSESASATSTTSTNHEIKSERLPLGDIIIHDPKQEKDIVLFERKSLNDLAASIRDGRYKEQSFRLSQTTDFHNHNIIYIIEGDIAKYRPYPSSGASNGVTKSALQSAMVSLLYYKGFSVIRTMNVGETADFILHFADKVAKESAISGTNPAYSCSSSSSSSFSSSFSSSSGTDTTFSETTATATATATASTDRYSEVASKKEKRDFITRENIGEIMLAQIPGVSPKIAAGIMKKYGGSVYEFLGDLRRKLNDYEESISPQMSPPSPVLVPETLEPMNKNKLKHVSECFKDVGDGKRNIGKATIEKLCYFLG